MVTTGRACWSYHPVTAGSQIQYGFLEIQHLADLVELFNVSILVAWLCADTHQDHVELACQGAKSQTGTKIARTLQRIGVVDLVNYAVFYDSCVLSITEK